MNNKKATIELNGVKLTLVFGTENCMELSAITGMAAVRYIERGIPAAGETMEQAAIRCADAGYLVPLIMAGLAHLDEYGGLTQRQLRRKVCQLIDAESIRRKESTLAIQVELFAKILPAVAMSIAPPGETLDNLIAKANKQEGKEDERQNPQGPPAEGETSET